MTRASHVFGNNRCTITNNKEARNNLIQEAPFSSNAITTQKTKRTGGRSDRGMFKDRAIVSGVEKEHHTAELKETRTDVSIRKRRR